MPAEKQQTEAQNDNPDQSTESGAPEVGSPEAGGDVSPRAEQRIHQLTAEKREQQEKYERDLQERDLRIARMEGQLEEIARRGVMSSAPEKQPEFENEAERLQWEIEQERKRTKNLEARFERQEKEQKHAQLLASSLKGLSFGDFEDEAHVLVATKLKETNDPRAARLEAERLAKKYGAIKAPTSTPTVKAPTDPSKYVEDKTKQQLQTKAPAATTASPAPPKTVYKSSEEAFAAADARLAARLAGKSG
jgi:hypothetical protein